MKNFRAEENGAEWVTKKEQSLTRIAHVPFDQDSSRLPDHDVFLRVWSPLFARLEGNLPVAAAIEKIPRRSGVQIRRRDPKPVASLKQSVAFGLPIPFPDNNAGERIYALPLGLVLEPYAEYEISGWIQNQTKTIQLFAFNFRTGSAGRPLAF